MPQSEKPQAAQRTPLRVNVVYAKPAPEGDEAWLRALKILMETEPKKRRKGKTDIQFAYRP